MEALTEIDLQHALKELLRGAPLARVKDFLEGAYIEDADLGIGWPHLTSQKLPTVWGGTADGLIGILAAGASRHEPMLKNAAEWLMSQQREDGGFGTRELLFSAVESTAWVILAMRAMGRYEDARVQRACDYLEESVSHLGEVATSKLDLDNPRVYPAVLTLLALPDRKDVVTKVSRFLKDCRHAKTGGWSTHPYRIGKDSNAQSTAQALIALHRTRTLEARDVINTEALQYLISQQRANGEWTTFTETWYSKHQTSPNRCEEYPTAWALMALLEAGVPVTSPSVQKGIAWLVNAQEADGSWILDKLDGSKHIWCACDAALALKLAQERLLSYVSENGTLESITVSRVRAGGGSLGSKVLEFVRLNLTTLVVVLLGLYVFKDFIRNLLASVLHYWTDNLSDIVLSIVQGVVWVLVAGAATWLFIWVKKIKRPGGNAD